jgi:hypothetical protein
MAVDEVSMSDEKTTEEKPDSHSFEERVFARFDALDARIGTLEMKVDERAVETRPIWERALKEIADLRQDMTAALRKVEHKIDVLNRNILEVQADQRDLEGRVETLEKSPA